ncbi:MAG: hypothetical protein RBS88_13150, partial [Spongiibacteraceae bacterium]|nr:hypothetical protein [Spongiibacteraceae bacterium]
PLRHPEASRNWSNVCARLSETLSSLQTCCESGDADIMLIANTAAQLPPLPPAVTVIRVSDPAPPVSIFRGESDDQARRAAVWRDKGRKLAAGAIAARARGSRYVMPVDADDLVSREIPAFVKAHAGSPGWYVTQGWLLPIGSRVGVILEDFLNWCGTYVIVRLDLLPLGDSVDGSDQAMISSWLGHHRDLLPALARQGHILQPLPFPAAVYRIGHGDNNFQRHSLVSEVFGWPKLKKNPRQYLRRLLKIRLFSARQEAIFTGTSGQPTGATVAGR